MNTDTDLATAHALFDGQQAHPGAGVRAAAQGRSRADARRRPPRRSPSMSRARRGRDGRRLLPYRCSSVSRPRSRPERPPERGHRDLAPLSVAPLHHAHDPAAPARSAASALAARHLVDEHVALPPVDVPGSMSHLDVRRPPRPPATCASAGGSATARSPTPFAPSRRTASSLPGLGSTAPTSTHSPAGWATALSSSSPRTRGTPPARGSTGHTSSVVLSCTTRRSLGMRTTNGMPMRSPQSSSCPRRRSRANSPHG